MHVFLSPITMNHDISIQLSTESMEPNHDITQPMLGSSSTDSLRMDLQCSFEHSWRCVEPTIFRADEKLNSLTEMEADYFKPKLISIGPYHHSEQRLEAMERIKMYYLEKFLERSRPAQQVLNNISVVSSNAELNQYYISEIKKEEQRLRSTYSEVMDSTDSDEFVNMMLLDGCFVVEFLIELFCEPSNLTDPYKQTSLNTQVIMEDLMLLENQLPFFLLQKLFEFIYPGGMLCPIAICNICLCYDFLTQTPNDSTLKSEYMVKVFKFGLEKLKPEHLLHLIQTLLTIHEKQPFHCSAPVVSDNNNANELVSKLSSSDKSFSDDKVVINELVLRMCGNSLDAVPSPYFLRGFHSLTKAFVTKTTEDSLRHKTLSSATQLTEAGVKLKLKNESKSLVDITFHNGTLEIPKLCIFSNTMPLLWNIVAFEMCCFKLVQSKLSTYVMFIDNLIDTAEDAAILGEAKVIRHSLGNNENVTVLLNRIGTQVGTNRLDDYLLNICIKVNNYYSNRRVRWIAKLKRDYFSNPWAITSVIAAFVLLLLAAIQTIYTVLGYIKSQKP